MATLETKTEQRIFAEFRGVFERHYIEETKTYGRFWINKDDNDRWQWCGNAADCDPNDDNNACVQFEACLELAFTDEHKNEIDSKISDLRFSMSDLSQQSKTLDFSSDSLAELEQIKGIVIHLIDCNLFDASHSIIMAKGGNSPF